MSKRTPELLIEDILVAATKIQKYTAEMSFEEFTSDEKTIDAVVRNFEIIGEASNRLPVEFKRRHPALNWKRIRAFRNRIVPIILAPTYQSCGISFKTTCLI